jgi:hypothetical protein
LKYKKRIGFHNPSEKRLYSERDAELEKAATVFVFEMGYTSKTGVTTLKKGKNNACACARG